jgi:RHS repeat-associated protein
MSNSAWATALTSTRDSRSTTEIHNTSHDHIATPATIPLIATATPAAGTTITRIEVYSGTTLIGTSNGSTLNANWITLKPGTQTLTARAIDSNGGISTASVTITVTSAANETITFIHNDLAGSPMAATDINGAIVWKEDYSPYGERKQKEAASSNQHQWFGGKVQDSETGLSYFGARYYDPVVGRFMGVDAVGFNPGNLQSFNRYAYANNNPYRFVDPTGNAAEDWFPKDAPILAIGRAFGGLVAFGQGVTTGDSVLSSVASQGMADNRQANVEALFVIGSMGRGGAKNSATTNAEKASTLSPGPFAKESIPGHMGKPTASEQQQVNALMEKNGCHTCGTKDAGTKSGNAVVDHQPAQALGETKQFLPHCVTCMRRQGGEVRQELFKRNAE